MDDDYLFTEETRVQTLLRLVKEGVADIGAGQGYTAQGRTSQSAYLELNGDTLVHTICRDKPVNGIVRCDMVGNFFVARTDVVRELGGWDPELKLNEHTEFFVRAKLQGLRVVCCPQVKAFYDRRLPPGYRELRRRSYRHVFMEKYGLHRWETESCHWDLKEAGEIEWTRTVR